ncbi:hypothetical protein DCCM_3550 [Desulfocucumis palustris]|uniref:Uncharacterized protein n=1 Tax=Desulfocucumis palustris TaxID=1898651 RepID=A0A2L2XE80_9FIRM|nr:hypothetical protein DCCM_3550 [Desulfocucumis palustris]
MIIKNSPRHLINLSCILPKAIRNKKGYYGDIAVISLGSDNLIFLF